MGELALSSDGAARAGDAIAREIQIVRETRAGGEKVFDFALVSGVPNLVQALYLKASTQPGELPLHPSYGFAIPVGTRLLPLTLFLAKFQAYRTLAVDDRLDAVEDLALAAQADRVRMRVRVLAAGTRAVLGATTAGF